LARAVNAVRLAPRGRVGISMAVDNIAVARARSGLLGGQGEPALGFGTHRQNRVAKLQRDRARAWRPQAKTDSVRDQRGPKRKLMMPAHHHTTQALGPPRANNLITNERSGCAQPTAYPGSNSTSHGH